MFGKLKILGLSLAAICLLVVILRHQQKPDAPPPAPKQEISAVATNRTTASLEQAPPVDLVPTQQVQSIPTTKPKSKPSPQIGAQTQTVNPPKEPVHDPDAREALALVGLDPNAERYWLDAIFDSSLPANERGDLMEDLNETGFADPKNLTAADLELIANRLQIIDTVLANADDFMTPHLMEAQKDLINMFGRVVTQ